MRCRAQVATGLLTVLLPIAAGADGTVARSEQYSIGFGAAPAAAPPHVTLLDPTWLLPPVEILEAAGHRSAGMLGARLPRTPAAARAKKPGSALSYALGDGVSAQVRYRRSFLFETSPSRALRDEGPRTYSSQPIRDVLGLGMSWRLAGSTLGLGYQLESAPEQAGADAGVGRFLPGSQQATHSLTLGWTREWGRAPRPPLIDVPFAAEPSALGEPSESAEPSEPTEPASADGEHERVARDRTEN